MHGQKYFPQSFCVMMLVVCVKWGRGQNPQLWITVHVTNLRMHHVKLQNAETTLKCCLAWLQRKVAHDSHLWIKLQKCEEEWNSTACGGDSLSLQTTCPTGPFAVQHVRQNPFPMLCNTQNSPSENCDRDMAAEMNVNRGSWAMFDCWKSKEQRWWSGADELKTQSADQSRPVCLIKYASVPWEQKSCRRQMRTPPGATKMEPCIVVQRLWEGAGRVIGCLSDGNF